MIALIVSIVMGWSPVPAAAMLALGPIWALYYAWHAPLEKCHESILARLLIAYLAYTGTMSRTITRYRTRAKALAEGAAPNATRQRPSIDWAGRKLRLEYWNEGYITRDSLLDSACKLFSHTGHPVVVDPGWNDFDVEVRSNPWTRLELKTADEEHGGMKIKTIVVARVKVAGIVKLATAATVAGAVIAGLAGLPEIALGLGALTIAGAICAAGQMAAAGRLAYRAIEECAVELNLTPLGKPAGKPSRSNTELAAEKPVGAGLSAQERAAD
jgi:hypothetical protein